VSGRRQLPSIAMNPTPTTRGRHALRWVLGVGLVFVVVSAMALQDARRRADERWVSVVSRLDEEFPSKSWAMGPRPITRGGTVFREWRQGKWDFIWYHVVVRQERILFGSYIEARASLDWNIVKRANFGLLLAELDIDLVVDP